MFWGFVSDNSNAVTVKNNLVLPRAVYCKKKCKECIVLGWLDGKQNQCITHPVSFGLAFSVLHGSKKNTFVQFTHKGRGRMYLSYNITLCSEKYQCVSLPCACKHMGTKAALVFHGNCSF